MIGQACDYSLARPAPDALKAAGFEGVVRYATRFGFDKAEYDALLAAGLQVAIVMEWGSQPALRGQAGGVADAQAAEATAAAVGYPPDAVIYYVAEDPNRLPQSDWPTVDAYFDGVASVNPARPRGAYGSLALVEHLQAAGRAKYGWVVYPWGGTSPNVHLAQYLGAVPPQFAGQIDSDGILQADWGQAPRPNPDPPDPPVEEDPMLMLLPGQHVALPGRTTAGTCSLVYDQAGLAECPAAGVMVRVAIGSAQGGWHPIVPGQEGVPGDPFAFFAPNGQTVTFAVQPGEIVSVLNQDANGTVGVDRQ